MLVLAGPWIVCAVRLCLAGVLCVGVLPVLLALALVTVPIFITASLAWCDRLYYHHVHVSRLFKSCNCLCSHFPEIAGYHMYCAAIYLEYAQIVVHVYEYQLLQVDHLYCLCH